MGNKVNNCVKQTYNPLNTTVMIPGDCIQIISEDLVEIYKQWRTGDIEEFIIRLDTNELIVENIIKHKLSREMISVDRNVHDGDRYLIWRFTENKEIKLSVIFLCAEVKLNCLPKCDVLSLKTTKLYAEV